jgi:hypothetical protein
VGLVLTEIAPHARSALRIPGGLAVDRIQESAGPSALQSGDVIVAVNDMHFRTREDFDRLVALRAGLPLALLVMRAGRAQYVALASELL